MNYDSNLKDWLPRWGILNMIRKFQLIRNVGQFDNVSGASIPLDKLTLIYAENGRGKTTLCAILRSLATADPLPIIERRRLGAPNPPHIIFECDNAPSVTMFQNSGWNLSLPNIAIVNEKVIHVISKK